MSSIGARECDSCQSARAAVYCRADSAYLCTGCDAGIHAANPISCRHHRVPLASSSGYSEDVDNHNDYEALFGEEVDDYLDLVDFKPCAEDRQKLPIESVVPKTTTELFSAPQLGRRPMDREARVLRYREKKKNRKFEKTIRYASRKAYAEARPRIKGRFAKRRDVELEVDQMFSNYVVPEDSYGIVPSF